MSGVIQPIGVVPNRRQSNGLPPLSRTKTLSVLGEEIPVYWFEESPTIDDIMKMKSADARTVVIRDLYEGGTIAFYADLVKSGKGQVCLLPVSDKDYQHGRLWQIEFNDVLNKYLEVINQTPEPYAVDDTGKVILSKQELKEKGLTEEGKRIVFLGVDPTIQYETIWQAWFWTFGIEAKWPEDIGFNASNFIET